MSYCKHVNVQSQYQDSPKANIHHHGMYTGVASIPGLVKVIPAVARLLCLTLTGSSLNVFAQNEVELCILLYNEQACTACSGVMRLRLILTWN